jgi:hypothetical protein
MKRIVSIPLLFIILFSGINVNFASHYCRGNFSGTKVSLTGELATCGMEQEHKTESSVILITTHCCDDKISSFFISTNYVPSSYCHLPEVGQQINNYFFTQNQLFISGQVPVSTIAGNNRPPGRFSPASVEQQVICIFRI